MIIKQNVRSWVTRFTKLEKSVSTEKEGFKKISDTRIQPMC